MALVPKPSRRHSTRDETSHRARYQCSTSSSSSNRGQVSRNRPTGGWRRNVCLWYCWGLAGAHFDPAENSARAERGVLGMDGRLHVGLLACRRVMRKKRAEAGWVGMRGWVLVR